MPYRIFNTQTEVAEYADSLDTRWPQRHEIAKHISSQLAHLLNPTPFVVELCCGPGKLASVILADHPSLHYMGLDISQPSLAFAQDRLGILSDRVRLIQADLNQDGWLENFPEPPHAIVSMQSLHDLGGEESVSRIYALAKAALAPGGLFVNADLLAHTVREPDTNPGRLSLARHTELLSALGYENVSVTLEAGDFGCVVASVES